MDELNYKEEYLKITNLVAPLFPECETTVTDFIRHLIFENQTYRIALGLPLQQQVLNQIEDLNDKFYSANS